MFKFLLLEAMLISQYMNKIKLDSMMLCITRATNEHYKVVKYESALLKFFNFFHIFTSSYASLRLHFHVHLYNAIKCLFFLYAGISGIFYLQKHIHKLAVVSVGRIVRTKNARIYCQT